MFTFEKKNVQTFFNLLVNFVGQNISLNNNKFQESRSSAQSKTNGYAGPHGSSSQGSMQVQILAPGPFLNCTYNSSNLIFKGISSENSSFARNKSDNTQKFQYKATGLIFRHQVLQILEVVQNKYASMSQSSGLDVSVNFSIDLQSKMLS